MLEAFVTKHTFPAGFGGFAIGDRSAARGSQRCNYVGSSVRSQGNDAWVEDSLRKAKQLVSEVDECPEHAADCEHAQRLVRALEVMPQICGHK